MSSDVDKHLSGVKLVSILNQNLPVRLRPELRSGGQSPYRNRSSKKKEETIEPEQVDQMTMQEPYVREAKGEKNLHPVGKTPKGKPRKPALSSQQALQPKQEGGRRKLVVVGKTKEVQSGAASPGRAGRSPPNAAI